MSKRFTKTSLFHIESNLDRHGLLSPTHGERPAARQSILINKPKSFKGTDHTSCGNKEKCDTAVHGGGSLKLVKLTREPSSIHPKTCASLKNSSRTLPVRRSLLILVGRKQTGWCQRSTFPSEPSRFAPLILAHRGSALPRLVDDRAALRPRQIWCLLTR